MTRSEVGRSAARRSDEEWLAAAWAVESTRVLVIDEGQALARIADGAAELVFVSPRQAPGGVRFLLGVDADEVAYFGVAATLPTASGEQDAPGDEASADADVRRAGLREAGALLPDRDAGLLTHAIALANWHAVAAYCARCGSPTEPILSGHARRCTADGSEQFPRLDPAVIMLVTDPDDRCLLARNVQWPPRRVSVLAGFVEPGESAEQAVSREVHEEVGICVTSVTYVGSQPWPLPHNLMLGFRAEAVDCVITVDADEIAEARWYTRDELADAIMAGDLLMPPSLAISRWLIEAWYGGSLPRPGR